MALEGNWLLNVQNIINNSFGKHIDDYLGVHHEQGGDEGSEGASFFDNIDSMIDNLIGHNDSHEENEGSSNESGDQGEGGNEGSDEGGNSQQTEVVNVSSEGSFDAAGEDYAFHFAEGNYTYQIQDFEHGDALVFPEGATPTLVNSDFSDGKVEVQWAHNGNVIKVDSTGLSSDVDSSLLFMSDFESDQASGGYTLPEQGNNNEGSNEGSNELTINTVPVNGTGNYTASDDVAETFQFTEGSYDYTVNNFDLDHDVLDFPDSADPTLINSDFSDGEATVQWAGDGKVISVHLVGLTQQEDGNLMFTSDLGDALA